MIDGDHSGHLGLILVVVPMLPVAAYAPKVFYFVQEIFYLIEFVIAAEIRGTKRGAIIALLPKKNRLTVKYPSERQMKCHLIDLKTILRC